MNEARRMLLAALLWAGPWVGNAEGGQEQGSIRQEGVATGETADRLGSVSSGPLIQRTNGLTSRLQMNFRNVSLDSVLDYLSVAAGFILHKEADPKGTFDFWSKDSLNKEEALSLINSVLKKNGYTLICAGRILTVVSLDSIKTADLDVVSGNNPDDVNKSDEVITQVIAVRYANAGQLLNNLQLFLPASASLSANESANSLILVASKTVVRRMLRIVKALDTSITTVSSIKVFPLRYADAKQLASVTQQFFSTQSGSGGMITPGGFGPPGFGGPPEAAQSSGDTGRTSAASKVVAAADETSNSLIVSAAADLITAITRIVQQVDRPMTAATEVRIFKLQNADPAEIANQLAQLFPDTSKNNSDQQAPVFGGPPGPGGLMGGPGGPGGPPGFGMDNGGSSDGTRAKTGGKVIGVADPRTSSLLVSASIILMPQIARMIEQLDASSARREIVKVFELQNADPQDVNQVLADLFNRNSSMRNNNNNNRSLLGQSNPLTTRETQQQTSSSSQSSGFGNSGGQRGAGAPGGGGGTATGF